MVVPMNHRILFMDGKLWCLALVAVLAGCSGGSSSATPDAAAAVAADAAPPSNNTCTDGGVAPSICTINPALASVTDLTGTWVLATIGAQLVNVPSFTEPLQIKSVSVMLAQVVQTGNDVTFTGQYCDRIQQDDPKNPAQVVVGESWRLTPTPFARTGTFAPDLAGVPTLVLPSFVEVFGARLTDQACEILPVDSTDPRLFDDDNDGYPGISVQLTRMIVGSLRSVQRQSTALTGVVVAENRIEGGMAYLSDQSVVDSIPPSIKARYAGSTAFADPAACASSFVMIKVPDDAVPVDCEWVLANENALLGL
jgi:hypothetical protein